MIGRLFGGSGPTLQTSFACAISPGRTRTSAMISARESISSTNFCSGSIRNSTTAEPWIWVLLELPPPLNGLVKHNTCWIQALSHDGRIVTPLATNTTTGPRE